MELDPIKWYQVTVATSNRLQPKRKQKKKENIRDCGGGRNKGEISGGLGARWQKSNNPWMVGNFVKARGSKAFVKSYLKVKTRKRR